MLRCFYKGEFTTFCLEKQGLFATIRNPADEPLTQAPLRTGRLQLSHYQDFPQVRLDWHPRSSPYLHLLRPFQRYPAPGCHEGHSDYQAMKPYIEIAEKTKADAMKLFEQEMEK